MSEEKNREPLFISVVIPVLNEGKCLETLVQALLQQDYPRDRFEVLVVDGGSTDDTLSIAGRLSNDNANVRVLQNSARLSSSGRNMGARAAKGDVMLFVDGHCEIPDALLFKNLDSLFVESAADVMCRPQPLETSDATATQKSIALARTSWLGHNPGSFIFASDEEGYIDPQSSGAAYTRRVFEKIGYFDDTFDACEDVDFNLRARKSGFKAFTSPRLAIRYRPRDSMASLFDQMLRYGSGRARLFRKHPADGLPGAFMLGVLPVLVVAAGVYSAFSYSGQTLLASLVLIYVAAVAATSVALSARNGFGRLPAIVSAFFVIHGGLIAGFWTGLFRRIGRRGRAVHVGGK